MYLNLENSCEHCICPSSSYSGFFRKTLPNPGVRVSMPPKHYDMAICKSHYTRSYRDLRTNGTAKQGKELIRQLGYEIRPAMNTDYIFLVTLY